MDVPTLESLVRRYFACGIASSTSRTYTSARSRYLAFCEQYDLPSLPLTERTTCLFAAFLAQQGIKPQSISVYLAALRHLTISAGLDPPLRATWPRLQYVLRGIKRTQDSASHRVRLPITAEIMRQLQNVWSNAPAVDQYQATMLWAACCLGFFGFMRAGEFSATNPREPPSIRASDVAVDSHANPTMVRVFLRRAKTDPFGKGVSVYLGRTNSSLCPISALLNYLAIRPPGEGPLFTHQSGTPLSRDQFVRGVKAALSAAHIAHEHYSGHSFRIGAATAAAAAGVPAHIIKMLGRWSSEAYLLYVRTPRETLASISRQLAL